MCVPVTRYTLGFLTSEWEIISLGSPAERLQPTPRIYSNQNLSHCPLEMFKRDLEALVPISLHLQTFRICEIAGRTCPENTLSNTSDHFPVSSMLWSN